MKDFRRNIALENNTRELILKLVLEYQEMEVGELTNRDALRLVYQILGDFSNVLLNNVPGRDSSQEWEPVFTDKLFDTLNKFIDSHHYSYNPLTRVSEETMFNFFKELDHNYDIGRELSDHAVKDELVNLTLKLCMHYGA